MRSSVISGSFRITGIKNGMGGSKWEMQDTDGENCFPNHRLEFNIRINVIFHTSDGGETRG
jgi:hypothetical protein